MESFIWIERQDGTPEEAKEISGSYTALVNGTECVVELELNDSGGLRGSFYAEGERLEVSGGISNSGAVFGFLLDPVCAYPVALFRARRSEGGMTFEVDVPDFDELMDLCNPERLTFSKVAEQNFIVGED